MIGEWALVQPAAVDPSTGMHFGSLWELETFKFEIMVTSLFCPIHRLNDIFDDGEGVVILRNIVGY